MDMITTLYKINRWWTTGKVDKPFLYKVKRDEFKDIQARLEDRRILSLIGPRRVGKSTLMYETIDYLIEHDVDPKRILLFRNGKKINFTLLAKNAILIKGDENGYYNKKSNYKDASFIE